MRILLRNKSIERDPIKSHIETFERYMRGDLE